MTIKKNFQELVTLLETNKNVKVSDILDQVLELAQSKVRESVYKFDELGNVTHVFCYYHKVWESLEECEYGSKASSKHNINNMCKIGVNQWTQQQKEYTTLKAQATTKILDGSLDPSDLQEYLDNLETQKNRVESREEYLERKVLVSE